MRAVVPVLVAVLVTSTASAAETRAAQLQRARQLERAGIGLLITSAVVASAALPAYALASALDPCDRGCELEPIANLAASFGTCLGTAALLAIPGAVLWRVGDERAERYAPEDWDGEPLGAVRLVPTWRDGKAGVAVVGRF